MAFGGDSSGGAFWPFPLPVSGISTGLGPYQNLFKDLEPIIKTLCLWIPGLGQQGKHVTMEQGGVGQISIIYVNKAPRNSKGKKRRTLLERLGLRVLSELGLVGKLVADSLQ